MQKMQDIVRVKWENKMSDWGRALEVVVIESRVSAMGLLAYWNRRTRRIKTKSWHCVVFIFMHNKFHFDHSSVLAFEPIVQMRFCGTTTFSVFSFCDCTLNALCYTDHLHYFFERKISYSIVHSMMQDEAENGILSNCVSQSWSVILCVFT